MALAEQGHQGFWEVSRWDELWHLNNTGQAIPVPGGTPIVGTPGSDIHILPVWRKGIMGDPKIIVAVIDTGISPWGPDLKDSIFVNPKEIPGNGIDDDGNGLIDDIQGWNFLRSSPDVADHTGHGNHVAGVLAARGLLRSNQHWDIGSAPAMIGVSPETTLLPIAVGDTSGDSCSAIVPGIRYAIRMGARIINASYAGPTPCEGEYEAIAEARDAGILLVAGAGNDASNNDLVPMYPASFDLPNVITVAATDNRDQLAIPRQNLIMGWKGSNFGRNSVHVAAPGDMIVSVDVSPQLWLRDATFASPFSGTSMAAPQVSGIAALLLQIHPNWTYRELKDAIIRSCDPVPDLQDKVVCGGRVNAERAINFISTSSAD